MGVIRILYDENSGQMSTRFDFVSLHLTDISVSNTYRLDPDLSK